MPAPMGRAHPGQRSDTLARLQCPLPPAAILSLALLLCPRPVWGHATGGDPERHVRVRQRGSVLNMLRRLDKIRFRGHKRDDFLDLAESPNASDNECGDDVPLRAPRARDSEELRDPAGPGTLIMAAGVQDFNRTESDRLNEIKGHLEIALLEKHFLQEELRKLREETNSEMLRQELDRERQRRIELEQKVQEVLKARTEEQAAQQPPRSQAPVANGAGGSRGLPAGGGLGGDPVPGPTWPGPLHRNQVRVSLPERGAKPVTSFVKNLSALSDWHSVYTSAIAFTVYMNAVWHGWAIPMFLFLAILRLSLNYLIARGWRIQWSIVPEAPEPLEPPKEDLTVSEKFQLVLDVAQKAQVRSPAGLWPAPGLPWLLPLSPGGWVQPEITQKLYVALWAAFLASCCFPYRLVGLAVGLYAGIKFFLIDFVFKRCPRLRAKYDTPYIIWKSLPTDPQLKERSSAAAVSRRVSARPGQSPPSCVHAWSLGPCPSRSPAFSFKKTNALRTHLGKDPQCTPRVDGVVGTPVAVGPAGAFWWEPRSVCPSVCENGWRCCLINRDRKMPTDYIRNGVLYVTEKSPRPPHTPLRAGLGESRQLPLLWHFLAGFPTCGHMEWVQVCVVRGAGGAHTRRGQGPPAPQHRLSLFPCGWEARPVAPRSRPGFGEVARPRPQGEACGDLLLVFQYKVLSVLPGSGMGIAVTTPSTQKVSAEQAGAPGPGQSHRPARLQVGRGLGLMKVGACVASVGLPEPPGR
ncbi:PREDICTED: GRAM domain-containing protein 4 [Myotis davidii]|uniref:GRAM domain-containing protein 4 n=1 Tax=Myotis davidii TaxID=225400 RepID=UPI00076733E7|nr:PREDICTED: GRAM domain-containing protein 4 [Myotis davidii]